MKNAVIKTSIPTLRNFMGGVLFGLLIVGLMISTLGCSKKDKGNAGYVHPGFQWGGQYNGGPSVGQYVGNSAYGLQLALQFNSQNGSYVGPVWANGQISIRSSGVACAGGGFSGFDFLPGGLWQIDPTNQVPGYIELGFVEGVTLLAYGPNGRRIRIEIEVVDLVGPGVPGYINGSGYTCNGIGGFNEMFGMVKIYNEHNAECLSTYVDYHSSLNPSGTSNAMVCL